MSMKLLITGRDAGTVRFITDLAKTARACNWIVSIAAQPPASQMLKEIGIECDDLPGVTVGSSDDPNLQDLMSMAQRLVETHSPDAILTTISGPRAGIDEAILRLKSEIPRYSSQGYPGNLNHALGTQPDIVFVADSPAVELTAKQMSAPLPPIIPVGSLIAQSLHGRDWTEIRSLGREKLGCGEDVPIFVYFLQPLEENVSYVDSVIKWARCTSKLGRAIIRSHPGKKDSTILKNIARLGLNIVVEPTGLTSVEQIAASDVVSSAFSSANMETDYINCLLDQPGPVSHYVLPEGVMSIFRDSTGLEAPPNTTELCAAVTEDMNNLSEDLRYLLENKGKFHSASRRNLSVPSNVSATILTRMKEHMETRRSADTGVERC